jgi:hypothetical protein
MQASPGERKRKTIVFTGSGQSATFHKNDVIELITDGIDFSRTTFKVKYSNSDGSVIISTVDIENDEILFSSKCQTFEWYDPYNVPPLKVSAGLKPEQIVVTPLFDDNCNRVGFQIRYGSIESGCRKEGIKELTRFNKCTGKYIKPKRKRKKIEDVIPLKKKLF